MDRLDLLSGDLTVDVALVGASPANIEIGLRLRRAGVSVALLEANPLGSTGAVRDIGLALPGLNEHYWSLCQALDRPVVSGWWDFSYRGLKLLEARLEQLCPDSGWVRGGLLQLSAGEPEWNEIVSSARMMSEDGFDSRLMSEAAATNYAPVESVGGVAYVPGAICFDPLALCHQGVDSFKSEGGRFVYGEVLEVERVGEAVRCKLESGQVYAEMAVVSAGHRSRTLLGMTRESLFPLRGQAFSTAAVREGPRGSTPAVACNRGHERYRRNRDGGMLVSGINPGSTFREKTEVAEVDPEFQAVLEQLARDRFPEMRRVAVEARWGVVHTYSADGLPLIGTLPGEHRLLIAAGFASYSWSLGIAAGEALANIILGQDVQLPEGSTPRRFFS